MVIEQLPHGAAPHVEPLPHKITEPVAEQGPALGREVSRFAAGDELSQQGIDPLGEGAGQGDQRPGFIGAQLAAATGPSQGVAAAAAPEGDAIGKLTAQSQLVAAPEHGFAAMKIKGFDGEQQQVEALETPTGQRTLRHRSSGNGGQWGTALAAMMAGVQGPRHPPACSMSTEVSPTSPLDERLRAVVRTVPDFPRPGILFRDLTPLMRDPEIWKLTLDGLARRVDVLDADLIVGIEARGFLVGNALALVLGRGFVPVRKPGKLPGSVEALDYQLEYGSDRLEIQSGALESGQKVLVVDDLLATGGTAAACASLVQRVGGEVVGYGFLAELSDLGGRSRLPGPAPVESLLLY